MAIDQEGKPCTIVLHDDRVDRADVLAGSRVLHVGEYAWLISPHSTRLCISPAGQATNSLEISVHVNLAKRFGLKNRTQGCIQLIEDVDTATATHVELFFRDQYLSRADMWQLMGCVQDTIVYKGQAMTYLGSETAEVKEIFIAGEAVDSAISIHPHTKPIFRSGSARYTVLIEVSKEMLENWTNGELMYERLVDGFLSDLMRRWSSLKVRHQISIILFGRIRTNSLDDDISGRGRPQTDDFFHVVKSEAASHSPLEILRKIKRAFNDLHLPRAVSLAAESNMLEAIHLSALDFADDETDTHLTSRGNSIVAITAGPGIFEADRTLLKQTTNLLVGNSVGVDIVSLAPKPQHPVPLFKYDNNGTFEFALPHWVDISFWTGEHDEGCSAWNLSTIQGPVHAVSLPLLGDSGWSEVDTSIMDYHDDQVFRDTSVIAGDTLLPTRTRFASPQAGSVETIKGVPIPGSSPKDVSVSTQSNIQTESVVAIVSSTPSKESVNTAKRPQLSPHPLMQFGRKISLGPKGLAPSRSVASTTVSAAHASYGQQEKDFSVSPVQNTDSGSGLAKAIRASLARKPSQQTLKSNRISNISDPENAQNSKPIDIHAIHESSSNEMHDPASDVEQRLADTMVGNVLENNVSLSTTPKAGNHFQRKGSMNDSLDMLAPWVMLLNPCHPRRDNMRIASQYRKWQHVFPRAVSAGSFKWASLCSPAALPLTAEYKPSATELEMYYNKKVRRHNIANSSGLLEETARILVEKLINVRLIWGFQIVVIRNSGGDQTYQTKDKPVLLSRGRQYHEIQHMSDFELQIVQYDPKSGLGSAAVEEQHYLTSYDPKMKLTTGVTLRAEVSYHSDLEIKDWAPLDEHILGLAPMPVELNATFKLRFLLIPVDLNKADRSGLGPLTEDERRLEGIHRLTQAWQRQKHISAEDQQHHASLVKAKTAGTPEKRDPNPLAIEYRTKDPSVVVNAHGPALSTQLEEGELNSPLFPESEKHHSSNFDVARLVKQMQELPPFGVEMRDRRWLTLSHLKCFRGDELTTWLLGAFKDLELREDAVALGNELLNRGIFHHVRQKHRFRDGHYFYQISSAHRTTEYPDTQGLFSKAPWKSVPATPVSESVKSPGLRPVSGDSSSSSGKGTPVTGPLHIKQLLLSQVMQYNVDPMKKSDHLQVIDLHYDRIHNPENCYHIQLEWLGTSTKLVREAISHWARLVEGYGLKLVQVPLQEASKFRERHPFDQPQPIKLAVQPPSDEVLDTPVIGPQVSSPQPIKDRFAYHKAILRKNEFALDYEAASSFTSDLHVSYSWGSPSYSYTQFIHKTGLVLAQIVGDDTDDFLLLPNRLATNSMSGAARQNDDDTVENISKELKEFCQNGDALRELYTAFSRPHGRPPSPLNGATQIADLDVPPISLPAHLSLRTGHRQILKDAMDHL